MKHILDIFPGLGDFFLFFNGGRGAICCRSHSRSPVINVLRNTTFIHTREMAENHAWNMQSWRFFSNNQDKGFLTACE